MNRRVGSRDLAALGRGRVVLGLLAAAFLLRGVFLDMVLPYADPFDEPFHYGYAAHLEATGRPPRARELSMPADALRPLHWLPRSGALPGPRVSWKDFAAMSERERRERTQEAFRFDASERAAFVTINGESQQPPLAYIPAAGLLRFLNRAAIDRRLLALRLLAAALATLTVPLAHAFFRRLLPRRGALAATAAFVAFPGVGSWVGRFTNDALALPIVTALLILFADIARGRLSRNRAGILAALLALGCWTKLYVLLLLPAAPLAAFLAPRSRRSEILRGALAACAVAFLLASPWLAHQQADTGDWLGLNASKQAVAFRVTLGDRVQAVGSLLRLRFWIVFGRTFLWPGTWSAMGAPAVVAVLLVLVLAALILVPRSLSSLCSRSRARASRGALIATALFLSGQVLYADTYAAVARVRGHAPSAGPDGWYLLVLFPALLTAGCAAGSRVPSLLLLSAAGFFAVCEWGLTLGVLPAVYAGWTEPNGANAPLAVWIKMAVSPARAFESYARVGLAQASVATLALLFSAWALSLGAALAFISRRSSMPRRP